MLRRDERARQRAARAGGPASRSPATPVVSAAIGNRALGRVVRSLQRMPVDTSKGRIETDDYTVPQLVELIRKLSRSRHQVDLAAAGQLRKTLGSTSGSHLLSEYYDEDMEPRGPLALGVQERYLKPVTPPLNAPPNVPQRSISAAQVTTYAALEKEILAQEAQYAATHVPFYHGQDPRWRVAQDVYRAVRERVTKQLVPASFHFMRYPGPSDKTYAAHEDVKSFFKADMEQHGIIDDNLPETKRHIMSTNIALHGGLGHAGEETFHYFQIAKGQTVPDVAGAIRTFLTDYGIPATGERDPQKLIDDVAAFNDTPEGSLFQILVPRKTVDEVAYLAHPHGLPHDDELFDELHGLTEIRYNEQVMGKDGKPVDRHVRYKELFDEERPTAKDDKEARKRALKRLGVSLDREKMNTEVTRNLVEARKIWADKDKLPQSERVEKVKRIHKTMVEQFEAGDYGPSRHIDEFVDRPEDLEHPEFEKQRKRVQEGPEEQPFRERIREAEERADARRRAKRAGVNVKLAVAAAHEKMSRSPEHFREGQGIRSKHENMRIRNRLNFIQARMLINERVTLNPGSGIIINRFTTMTPAAELEYRKRLDAYVARLFS